MALQKQKSNPSVVLLWKDDCLHLHWTNDLGEFKERLCLGDELRRANPFGITERVPLNQMIFRALCMMVAKGEIRHGIGLQEIAAFIEVQESQGRIDESLKRYFRNLSSPQMPRNSRLVTRFEVPGHPFGYGLDWAGIRSGYLSVCLDPPVSLEGLRAHYRFSSDLHGLMEQSIEYFTTFPSTKSFIEPPPISREKLLEKVTPYLEMLRKGILGRELRSLKTKGAIEKEIASILQLVVYLMFHGLHGDGGVLARGVLDFLIRDSERVSEPMYLVRALSLLGSTEFSERRLPMRYVTGVEDSIRTYGNRGKISLSNWRNVIASNKSTYYFCRGKFAESASINREHIRKSKLSYMARIQSQIHVLRCDGLVQEVHPETTVKAFEKMFDENKGSWGKDNYGNQSLFDVVYIEALLRSLRTSPHDHSLQRFCEQKILESLDFRESLGLGVGSILSVTTPDLNILSSEIRQRLTDIGSSSPDAVQTPAMRRRRRSP